MGESPLIHEVLARWTWDMNKLRRFHKWLRYVVDGRLSGEGFAWSIEIVGLTRAALAGFLTKLVPLISELSPRAAVSVAVRRAQEFARSTPQQLRPVDRKAGNDFNVDMR